MYVRGAGVCHSGIGTGHVKGGDDMIPAIRGGDNCRVCVYVRTPCHAMPIKVSRQDGDGFRWDVHLRLWIDE